MGKWVYIVQTVCTDDAKEKEFLEWYEKLHLPDLLKAPVFTRATLYVNDELAPGEGKYLAVYELDTEDVESTWKTYKEHTTGLRAQGRVMPECKVVARSLWRQMSPSQERRPGD